MTTEYFTLDFLPHIQRWVVVDPAGEIVVSRVTHEAAQIELHRLNNEHSLKEES